MAKAVGVGTINQIRPYRCVPLLLWDAGSKHLVSDLCNQLSCISLHKKNRGQHTESPFECCNLNFREFNSYECPSSQIVSKVKESYAELESTPQIRALMADHILNIQEAVTQAKAQLRSVLSKI